MSDEKYIEHWCYEHSDLTWKECLFVVKLREAGLNNSQIRAVLEIMADICTHCYDSDSSCQCWNDD